MIAVSSVLSSTAQDSSKLKKVWQTIDINSCPYNYNFHMHTSASDGKLTGTELIQQALNIGLKGLAITDHHSVNGYRQASAYLSDAKRRSTKQSHQIDSLTLWTGVEVSSRLCEVDVHILGYAFDPRHSAISKYLQSVSPKGKEAQAHQVINSIHQAGGLAVLAHPHRYRRSAQQLVPAAAQAGIDGIEVYYAYGKSNPWKPTPNKTEESFRLASQYDLYTTCGTDTHGSSLLQRV